MKLNGHVNHNRNVKLPRTQASHWTASLPFWFEAAIWSEFQGSYFDKRQIDNITRKLMNPDFSFRLRQCSEFHFELSEGHAWVTLVSLKTHFKKNLYDRYDLLNVLNKRTKMRQTHGWHMATATSDEPIARPTKLSHSHWHLWIT